MMHNVYVRTHCIVHDVYMCTMCIVHNVYVRTYCVSEMPVGGIMAFLTLHEMLPLAFEYAGHKTAVTSAFVGMAVMSANLQLLAMVVPPDVAL